MHGAVLLTGSVKTFGSAVISDLISGANLTPLLLIKAATS